MTRSVVTVVGKRVRGRWYAHVAERDVFAWAAGDDLGDVLEALTLLAAEWQVVTDRRRDG